MLGIAPTGSMAGDIHCSRFLEGHRLRGVEARFQPLSTPPLNRVNPIVSLKSEPGSSIARLGEPDGVQRTNSHPARSTVQHEPENPVFRAAVRHAQIEAAAVGVHAGSLRFVHLERRQPTNCSRHRGSTNQTTIMLRIVADGCERVKPNKSDISAYFAYF